MNDRQDPYGQIYGYDEYGRPLYAPPPAAPGPAAGPDSGYGQDGGYGQQAYPQDPGGHAAHPQGQQQGYGYDTQTGYDTWAGQQQPVHEYHPGGQHSGYGTGDPQAGWGHGQGQQAPAPQQAGYGYGYDTGRQAPVREYDTGEQDYGYAYDTGGQAPVREPDPVPRQHPQQEPARPVVPGRRGSRDHGEHEDAPAGSGPGGRNDYRTEQFSFIEEEDEESEDVIDWMKFTESRTERREEAKRRGRSRRRLLVVALVLALLGSTGYLWYSDRLPFLPGPGGAEETGVVAEQRDVIVVHLRETRGPGTSTVLLVANETTGEGTAMLLPNELAVSPDSATTTLGQAVSGLGAAPVRDAVGGLLGAEIKGTWRLDTPYLEILVDVLGGIAVDTDTEVSDADGEVVVEQGEGVTLDGRSAVVYATHRAPDEPQSVQLQRFGQVLEAALGKMPGTKEGATGVVESLAQIADPSLPEAELGASLARLAGLAQSGSYTSVLLPVEQDGTLSEETADGLVMDVLGGTVSNAEPGSAARIAVRDASEDGSGGETARVALVNGGFSVVDVRATESARENSEVIYADEAHRETAVEVARTLGLPEDAVAQSDSTKNADVMIVLGDDYGD
ncbi:polydiglycosylphosphate transferase PdtA [Streptomyces sodiiphilus]|uniref:Polydiglycosylphosphate transferase PdtA n=1 Tax=Streptomyces sodiiphilus TaxID=226217 RepID=A0ABP5B1S1_9ACTN